uniref:Ubiquitin carboxyl-terminal hydrolase n=1 Tax=Hucho hucho TaxID=62062 RepID=A0A4W5J9V3_9TELE
MEWKPMKINTLMLNKLFTKLCVCGSWRFVDMLCLDEEDLSSVPIPCGAVILRFLLTEQHELFREEQVEEGELVFGGLTVFFLRNKVVNSCGTVALLHTVAKNSTHMEYHGDSPVKKLAETYWMTPLNKAAYLEMSQAIRETYYDVAAQGQCQVEADHVNFHLTTFVKVNGILYELDPRMEGPVNHGDTQDNSFIWDAARVCREFVEREEGEVDFSAMAFCCSKKAHT